MRKIGHTFTATMSLILSVFADRYSGWQTAKELGTHYRSLAMEKEMPAVSMRTIHRNLDVMIQLGFVDADSPPRTEGRRYRATVSGMTARVTLAYGQPIEVTNIAHEHSHGRQCVRCRLEKKEVKAS